MSVRKRQWITRKGETFASCVPPGLSKLPSGRPNRQPVTCVQRAAQTLSAANKRTEPARKLCNNKQASAVVRSIVAAGQGSNEE